VVYRAAVFSAVILGLLLSTFLTLSQAQTAPPLPEYSQTNQSQAPTPPGRDPQAITLLQKSIAAMGGQVPADSIATGEIVVVAGSTSDKGKIDLSSRGSDQCAEHITLPKQQRSVIYSHGDADEIVGSGVKPSSLELAASSQCAGFPLPLLVALSADPDTSLEYLGRTIGWPCHPTHPAMEDIYLPKRPGVSFGIHKERCLAGYIYVAPAEARLSTSRVTRKSGANSNGGAIFGLASCTCFFLPLPD
jgi:hypothetical protein